MLRIVTKNKILSYWKDSFDKCLKEKLSKLDESINNQNEFSKLVTDIINNMDFWILDISNPLAPEFVGQCLPFMYFGIDEHSTVAHTQHCGGYGLDIYGDYAYIADDLYGIKIIDLTNISKPELVWVSDPYYTNQNLLGYSRDITIHNELFIVSDYYLGRIDILGFDSDGDGFADVADAFPTDSSEWLDTDGDGCLLYTSPSPRDGLLSRMPSSA